jgi:hypothetical protein
MDGKMRLLQHLSSTHDGAAAVAEAALDALIQHLGGRALPILNSMEIELVERYKNAEIAPELEMRHAEVITPVLNEITRLISKARADLE